MNATADTERHTYMQDTTSGEIIAVEWDDDDLPARYSEPISQGEARKVAAEDCEFDHEWDGDPESATYMDPNGYRNLGPGPLSA